MGDAPTPSGGDDLDGDAGLVSSRPPGTFRLVRTWVVTSVRELSDLRGQVLEEVAPERADAAVGDAFELDSTAHRMVLVASELATNALRHGNPPTIVTLLRERGTYLLDVADHDVGSVPHVAGDRPPGQGGFGLQIARRLALSVGWYATPTTKHVWARFAVP